MNTSPNEPLRPEPVFWPRGFETLVHANGYEFVRVRVEREPPVDTAPEDRLSIDARPIEWGLIVKQMPGVTRYASSNLGRVANPLTEEPLLYRKFATLEAEPAELVAFANEFGWLGRDVSLGGHLADALPGADRLVLVEPQREWRRAVEKMRAAVELYDMYKRSDEQSLRRIFHAERQADDPESWRSIREEVGFMRMWLSHTLIGGPCDIAFACVKQLINFHLISVSATFVTDPETGRDVVQMTPRNLLAAMWLQFAESIATRQQIAECRVCNKPFVINGDGRGRSALREFCTGPCKSRDYRLRKGRTAELAAEGKSPEAIAVELDTDLITVRRWLKGS